MINFINKNVKSAEYKKYQKSWKNNKFGRRENVKIKPTKEENKECEKKINQNIQRKIGLLKNCDLYNIVASL